MYVAITDYNNETKKEVELCVFTTAEESKQIIHRINKENEFKYDVISLSDYDSKEIINTIKHKLEHNIQITGKESVLFALTPLIEKTGNVEEYIDEVVNTLINLTGLTASIKALVFGIEWLIVDKFVKNEQQRNILCDLLGERMSLIHEYGQNKEKNGISKGEENIIRNQLKSGMKAEIIAKSAKVPLPRVKAIERKLKKEN